MSADQSRPVPRASEVEKLAQIRALCDRYHAEHWGWDEIRAILDAVPVDATPPQGIDRDALRAVLRDIDTDAYFDQRKPLDEQVDRILALVRPVQSVVLDEEQASLAAQALRRTAELLHHHIAERMISTAVYIEQGARLVRPVEGVVLRPEEAELAAPALRNAAARHATASGAAWHALAADLRALATRLEVS